MFSPGAHRPLSQSLLLSRCVLLFASFSSFSYRASIATACPHAAVVSSHPLSHRRVLKLLGEAHSNCFFEVRDCFSNLHYLGPLASLFCLVITRLEWIFYVLFASGSFELQFACPILAQPSQQLPWSLSCFGHTARKVQPIRTPVAEVVRAKGVVLGVSVARTQIPSEPSSTQANLPAIPTWTVCRFDPKSAARNSVTHFLKSIQDHRLSQQILPIGIERAQNTLRVYETPQWTRTRRPRGKPAAFLDQYHACPCPGPPPPPPPSLDRL